MKRKKKKLTPEFWARDAEARRELERRIAEIDAPSSGPDTDRSQSPPR